MHHHTDSFAGKYISFEGPEIESYLHQIYVFGTENSYGSISVASPYANLCSISSSCFHGVSYIFHGNIFVFLQEIMNFYPLQVCEVKLN